MNPIVETEVTKEVLPEVPLTAEWLRELGLSKAADKVASAEKQTVAYKHYRFLTQGQIDVFNQRLEKETLEETTSYRAYKRLAFIALKDYGQVPPPQALSRL